MGELKTQRTEVPIEQFLGAVEPARRRDEGFRLHAIMNEVTGDPGVMWGPSIVGYGLMNYTYANGKVGEWMKVGFSPRKAALSLYGLKDAPGAAELLERLGPHTAGMGCVYVKKLETTDEAVLRQLIEMAYARGDYVAPAR